MIKILSIDTILDFSTITKLGVYAFNSKPKNLSVSLTCSSAVSSTIPSLAFKLVISLMKKFVSMHSFIKRGPIYL